MIYFLLGIAALALYMLGTRRFLSANPQRLARSMRKTGGVIALVLALLVALTGRVALAIPLGFFGALLLARRHPFAPIGTAGRSPGRTSSVRTAFFEMVLDHETGAMRGRVLAGKYAGQDLGTLTRSDLMLLWQECRAAEPQSRQLLEAYLDRHWHGWREAQQQGRGEGARRDGGNGRMTPGRMTAEEALDVLGLKPGAAEDDIKAAHRNLMKRFHPDQGGSTYLAAKINEAKDVLLGKSR